MGWNWKSRVSSSWTVYVVWSCDFICRSWDNYMIILLFVYITNHVEVEGCNLCWWKLPLHKTRELLCTDEVMDLYPLQPNLVVKGRQSYWTRCSGFSHPKPVGRFCQCSQEGVYSYMGGCFLWDLNLSAFNYLWKRLTRMTQNYIYQCVCYMRRENLDLFVFWPFSYK